MDSKSVKKLRNEIPPGKWTLALTVRRELLATLLITAADGLVRSIVTTTAACE